MDEKLVVWLEECVGKGTFECIEDGIEFCIGATRAFCEKMEINQEKLKQEQLRMWAKGKKDYMHLYFPLKWSDELNKSLREDARGTVNDAVNSAIWDKSLGLLGDPDYAFDPMNKPENLSIDALTLWADYVKARRHVEKLQISHGNLMQERNTLKFKLGSEERRIEPEEDKVFFEALTEGKINRVQEESGMPMMALMEMIQNATEYIPEVMKDPSMIIRQECTENKADFIFKTPDKAVVRFLVEKRMPDDQDTSPSE